MILDEIVAKRRTRLAAALAKTNRAEMKKRALATPQPDVNAVYQLFRDDGVHIIGEVKKASPSKGLIAPDFDYQKIAKEYAQAGVTAISVLTEPDFFRGSLAYLEDIAREVPVPVLRKDFIIDDYMIYQARAAGVRIILLIVAILTPQQVADYLKLAHQLGLAALVEAHDADEVKIALAAGAQMIGVNNRNLKDFTVAPDNCLRLRDAVPADKIFIAESGIKSAADIQLLKEAGVNGVLIGETLMRAKDKVAKVKELKEES